MRLPVAGLIRLKRTVSASLVAGHRATGQVTRDRRRWPSHDGRLAISNPSTRLLPQGPQRGLNGGGDGKVAAVCDALDRGVILVLGSQTLDHTRTRSAPQE